MIPIDPVTDALARRLWDGVRASASSDVGNVAAAEQSCEAIRAGLSRWVGVDGHGVLLSRAMAIVAPEHPALRLVTGCTRDQPKRVKPTARKEKAVALGMMALLAVMIELLGRIIGLEMARQVIASTLASDASGAESAITIEGVA